MVASLLHRPPYPALSEAGHHWLSELLAHLSPATAHSVSSLTRLTRFRPSVWLPWSWGAQSGVVASLLHRAPYPALSKAGHQWLSELLAHLSPATAHSVFSLTRLTRFRPSVWLPWSWGAQSGVVASLLHSAPYPALSKAGHQWLSELLAHLNPATAHSVSSLTRLTRFRPSVGCHGHGELSQEWWLVYYTAPHTPP